MKSKLYSTNPIQHWSFLIILICGIIPLKTFANPKKPPLPKYQVEIIIFETTALKGWTEEFWPYQVPDIPVKNAYPIQPGITLPTTYDSSLQSIEASSPPSSDIRIMPLEHNSNVMIPVPNHAQPINKNHALLLTDKSLWLLNEEAQKLKPSKGYRILLHQSWTQWALPDQDAQPIYFENTPQSDYASGLSGTVRLYQQRYAHIEVQFNLDRFIPFKIRQQFAQHEDTEETLLPDFWFFHLNQSRKIKPRQLHYIDHPLFGVLIQIQRIK